MIVTRLIGGLGNQMFQYAHGLYRARCNGEQLTIDTSAFDNYDLHALAIDQFRITASRLSSQDSKRVPGRYRGQSRMHEAASRAFGRIRAIGRRPLRLVKEKPFGFAAGYLQSGRDLYLDGYWQGEAFFPDMRQELRAEFVPRASLSDATLRVQQQIQQGQSVAIHVRRGDYVSDAQAKKIYRSLDADYYRRCLIDLVQHVVGAKVFLFSNDIDWCLKHLDVGVPLEPVTHNDATTAHEDLFLMNKCRHHVIANSTFSWWGAFLSDDLPQSRVYCPEPWFQPGTLCGDAICCSDWIAERSLARPRQDKAA